MINWSNAIRAVVLFSVLAAILAAGLTYSIVRSNLDIQRKQAWEDLLWTSSQLEIEYLRFAKAVALAGARAPGVGNKAVVKRFDILWSRVNLFQPRRVRDRLASYPLEATPVLDLLNTLKEQEIAVFGLKAGDKRAASEILKAFDKHAIPLHSFNRNVMRGEQQREAGIREELLGSSALLTWLSIGAVAVSLALLIVFALETRRYRRMADANRSLFHSAQSANRTKSQFLTMMSHELRTPMNGILGMLALAKQQGVSPHQERLLDQAADSSKKMNGLLSDILDFSALEDQDFRLSNDLFEVSDLKHSVQLSLDPSQRQAGTLITIDIENSCPRRLKGDMRRLRQSIVHLADYLAQTAATRSVSIRMACVQSEFQVHLTYVYGEADADWHPSLILGEADRGDNTFASDALGPAVARGFIQRMGGSIMIFHPDGVGKQGALCLSIPMDRLASGDPVVRLETRTPTLATICESVLEADNVQIYQKGYEGRVDAVLIEAGSGQDAEILGDMRRQHPDATLMGLGRTTTPEQFDHIVELPVDVKALRRVAAGKAPRDGRKPTVVAGGA